MGAKGGYIRAPKAATMHRNSKAFKEAAAKREAHKSNLAGIKYSRGGHGVMTRTVRGKTVHTVVKRGARGKATSTGQNFSSATNARRHAGALNKGALAGMNRGAKKPGAK